MFQYGKVLKILKPEDKEVDSADKSVQAIVEMWDEVILACGVSSNLNEKLKAGDFVVTEISPISQNLFRHTVIKAVRGKAGLETWTEYKRVFNKRRQDSEGPMDSEMPKGRMIR